MLGRVAIKRSVDGRVFGLDKMDGSGLVKLNLKALNSLVFFKKTSSSSTLFRFQAPSLLSTTVYQPSSLVASRFSPLSTLSLSNLSKVHGYGTAAQPIPNNNNNNNNLLQVVLVSPQIPGNTGCIARTCAASGVKLHLVEPLGFQIDDAKLKRAGLDYWPYVVVKVHSSWAEFRDYFSRQDGEKRLLAFTKRGTSIHTCIPYNAVSRGLFFSLIEEFSYRPGDWLVFGSETSGLPSDALRDCRNEAYDGATIKIPMVDTYVRCLNLSVSVGIGVYEAARQLNYEQLQCSSESSINSCENPFITEDIFA